MNSQERITKEYIANLIHTDLHKLDWLLEITESKNISDLLRNYNGKTIEQIKRKHDKMQTTP